jgi:hypothetical protein
VQPDGHVEGEFDRLARAAIRSTMSSDCARRVISRTASLACSASMTARTSRR